MPSMRESTSAARLMAMCQEIADLRTEAINSEYDMCVVLEALDREFDHEYSTSIECAIAHMTAAAARLRLASHAMQTAAFEAASSL